MRFTEFQKNSCARQFCGQTSDHRTTPLALNLTALSVVLLKNSMNVPEGQGSVDALQKTFVCRMQVVHDFIVVKAPTGPVYVYPVREHNAEEVTETQRQRN